jgi:hypothetical protein
MFIDEEEISKHENLISQIETEYQIENGGIESNFIKQNEELRL